VAEPISALAGTGPFVAPGLRIAERSALAMTQVASFADGVDAVRAALETAFGVAPPVRPNTSAVGERMIVLWLGPGRWFVAEPRAGAVTDWHHSVRAAGGWLTDIGHGRTAIRVSGHAARALLAHGVGPDLHPRVFPPGACLQTNVAHTNLLLHAVDDVPSFDLYVPRSYAADVWDWLCDAAAPRGNDNS
jgi:sarcosine oxidase subunit gamma